MYGRYQQIRQHFTSNTSFYRFFFGCSVERDLAHYKLSNKGCTQVLYLYLAQAEAPGYLSPQWSPQFCSLPWPAVRPPDSRCPRCGPITPKGEVFHGWPCSSRLFPEELACSQHQDLHRTGVLVGGDGEEEWPPTKKKAWWLQEMKSKIIRTDKEQTSEKKAGNWHLIALMSGPILPRFKEICICICLFLVYFFRENISLCGKYQAAFPWNTEFAFKLSGDLVGFFLDAARGKKHQQNY